MNSPISAHWTDRLSEYLDGELAAPEQTACEAHLAGCGECARLLEELKAVAARAGSLPASPAPADLWAGIEARLETPVLQMRPRAAVREQWTRRWNLSSLQLAGAAAALIAGTVGVMWLAMPHGTPAPAAPSTRQELAAEPRGSRPDEDSSITRRESADVVEPPAAPLAAAPAPERQGIVRPSGPADASLASLDPDRNAPIAPPDFGLGRYDAAIAELEAALDAKRSRLNPETVRIVAANLATVDKAIVDARAALAADPASRYLNAHLASTMRRKVDLLRRLNSLARV